MSTSPGHGHSSCSLPGEQYGYTLHTLLGYTDVDESRNPCLPPGYPCLFAQHCSCHEPPTSEGYADALLHFKRQIPRDRYAPSQNCHWTTRPLCGQRGQVRGADEPLAEEPLTGGLARSGIS